MSPTRSLQRFALCSARLNGDVRTQPVWRLSKRGAHIAWVLTSVWAVAVLVGYRLPYLYTPFSFQVRFVVIGPALFFALLYFGWIRKNSQHRSPYQQMLVQIPSKVRRIKTAFLLVVGSVYIPWGLAWSTVFLTASAAQLLVPPFAGSFTHTYHIEDIDTWGGPMWTKVYELKLTEPSSGAVVSLPLKRYLYEEHNWKPGEPICVRGRQSIFGTIIDATSRNLAGCNT